MPYSTAYLALRDATIDALRQNHLFSALEAMKGQLVYLKTSWFFHERLDALRSEYRMLLTYLRQGAKDPSRRAQYESFKHRAYDLAEAIHREWQWTEGHRYGEENWQRLHRNPDAPSYGEVLAKGEYHDIFHYVWTSKSWRADHRQQTISWFLDLTVDVSLKATLLSALMLRLMASFDAEMHLFLFDLLLPKEEGCSVEKEALDLLLNEHDQLYERALVALVFVQMKHADTSATQISEQFPTALLLFPEHQKFFEKLCRDKRFIRNVVALQKMLAIANEAPRYAKRMENELMPELLKQSKHLPKMETLDIEQISREIEENPEMREAHDAILKAMGEFLRMQRSGVDASFSSFRQVQPRFLFFRDAANWFMPFSRNHPEVANAKISDHLWNFAFKGKSCDTDRFLTFKFIEQANNAATEQDQAKAQSWLEENAEGKTITFEVHESEDKQAVGENRYERMRAYVHDCYRFFHLYYHRREVENPFRSTPYLYDYPVFAPLFRQTAVAEAVAEELFKMKNYSAALPLLRTLPSTEDNLRYLGVACQLEGHEYEAIEAFEKLVLLNDTTQNVGLLAECCVQFERYEDAVVNYVRLEMTHPDDLRILYQLAYCFIRLELYAEATERLRHADYVHPKHPRVMSQLAWCLIMQRDFEGAAACLEVVMQGSPNANDFFNAGHCAWLSGDITSAIAYYGECLKARGEKYFANDFFDIDRASLLSLGLTESDLAMMLDLLNFDIEE